MYLSPSSCSPGSHNTWNIIGFWIPFGRIETVNCRINILNLYWLWTESSQSQRSRRNGASWEYCSCGWLLSRRCWLCWSRCSCRWFCRTRIFDTLLNGCRPVLTSAIGRIDDTAILQATADDPFGLSNSARDWTLKGKAFVRIIQPLFVSIAKEMKHHKFSTPSRNRIRNSAQYWICQKLIIHHALQTASKNTKIRYVHTKEAGIRKERRVAKNFLTGKKKTA